eukprot:COSAG01_NODE_1343_length_10640_cov_46.844322_2_plen_95_part_00
MPTTFARTNCGRNPSLHGSLYVSFCATCLPRLLSQWLSSPAAVLAAGWLLAHAQSHGASQLSQTIFWLDVVSGSTWTWSRWTCQVPKAQLGTKI